MHNKTEETKPIGKLRLRKKKELGAGKKNTSSLCSAHFTEDDVMRPLNLGAVKMKRELKGGQSGVCVFPSRHISRDNCEEEVIVIVIVIKYLYSAQFTICPWRFTLKKK